MRHYKEIRVTIEMNGLKYGYRQHVDDGYVTRNQTAYEIASIIEATIIENWDSVPPADETETV